MSKIVQPTDLGSLRSQAQSLQSKISKAQEANPSVEILEDRRTAVKIKNMIKDGSATDEDNRRLAEILERRDAFFAERDKEVAPLKLQHQAILRSIAKLERKALKLSLANSAREDLDKERDSLTTSISESRLRLKAVCEELDDRGAEERMKKLLENLSDAEIAALSKGLPSDAA